MSHERQTIGWWSYVRRVLLKPSWEFLTTGFIVTVLYVGAWWRDNTMAKGDIDAYATQKFLKFLPHWSPAWWICIGIGFVLFITIRESFRLFLKTEHSLLSLSQAIPFPELAVEAEFGVWVRNLSPTEAIFNVEIPSIRTVNGVSFCCIPEVVTSIAAGKTASTEIAVLTPKDKFSSYKNYVLDIAKLASKELAHDSKDLLPFATIVVFCEDGLKNRFKFEFPLSYNPDYMSSLPRLCTGTVKRERLAETTDLVINSNA